MNFRRAKIKNFYLKDTPVENIFLMEYMPQARGVDLKVYLTALMYADREDFSNRDIANHLSISEEEVFKAWTYWEQCGAVRKRYLSPEDRFHYSIEFLDLREELFDPQDEQQDDTEFPAALADRIDAKTARSVFTKIQEITGRLPGRKEMEDVLFWLYDDRMEPDLICFAYQYCAERMRNTNFSYVAAVIRNWRESGAETVRDAERLLAENDEKYHKYYRVMKALGFSRNPTEDEKEKIDSWFDDMGFSIETVLQACSRTSGISNPNINYVNGVLRNWSTGKSGAAGKRAPEGKNAVSQVTRMYEAIRRRNTELREAHRAEIYQRIPEIRELEDRLRQTNLAFTRLTLSGGNKSSVAALHQERDELTAKKSGLLQQYGYPADYMELHYDCERCKDTGLLDDGSRCACFAVKLREAGGDGNVPVRS